MIKSLTSNIFAHTQLHALKKEKIVKMNDHIDHFIKLLQEVEYHKPSGLLEMQKATVNLAFLSSLNGDDWETFQMAKSDSLRTMATAELFAEVDARKNPPQIQTPTQPPMH